MKYMLLICADEHVEHDLPEGAMEKWLHEMDDRGLRVEGYPLRPSSDATTVRVRSGAVHVSDGPFAVTEEQLAGYDVIHAKDLDEAIDAASKHPMAQVGGVEIRPFWQD